MQEPDNTQATCKDETVQEFDKNTLLEGTVLLHIRTQKSTKVIEKSENKELYLSNGNKCVNKVALNSSYHSEGR